MASTTSQRLSSEPRPADVLVASGITGDLAKVMTFRSLYRLEAERTARLPDRRRRRRRLDRRRSEEPCPRLDRRDRENSTRRSSSGSPTGSRTSAVTSSKPEVYGKVAKEDRREADARLLPGRSRRSCSEALIRFAPREAGLTENARVVVEKPFGHDLASASELADQIHQYLDESQPSPGSTTSSGRWGSARSVPALREHPHGADLEPPLRRERGNHDGRGFRRAGPRSILRGCRNDPDVVENHLIQIVA